MEFLLAQADTNNVMQYLGPLGVATILAWFMYYQTSVAGPAKDKLHAEERRLDQERHSASMNALVNEFRAESKEQRSAEAERMKISTELARSGHAGIHQITSAVNELRTAIRDMSESRTAGGH
jgi:hypothetical protein